VKGRGRGREGKAGEGEGRGREGGQTSHHGAERCDGLCNA